MSRAKAAAAVRPALAEGVDAVQDVAQSAAAFYERNKTQINAVVASATVGLVAYAGCTAMSFGTGAVACAGVAGAAGGAVYGAMTCPEGTSKTQCAAVGAVSGALGGVTAGGLAAAGVGLAGVGAGSAAASNVADHVMRTGEVDPKELLVSTLAGGAVGGLGGALGRSVRGQRASSMADDLLPPRRTPTPAKPSGAGGSAAAKAGGGASAAEPVRGQTVYRLYGGDSKATGASWSPVDPRSVPDFRVEAGLPSGGASGVTNSGRFVIEGELMDPSKIVQQRPALPLDGHKGGLPEYVIPGWFDNGAVRINRVSGVNPEF